MLFDTPQCIHPDNSVGQRYCRFLARYASYMLGCGATCIRISKNIKRIAATIGMHAHLITLPHNIIVHLSTADEAQNYHYSCQIAKVPVSYYINSQLSQLSWAMSDGEIDFYEAEARMERIVNHKRMNPWTVMILASLANAAFCRLFGGDPMAMAIVFLATAAGFSLKLVLLRHDWDEKGVWLVCATVSAMIAAFLGFRGTLTDTPDIALTTSVLYLIPGIPYINSVSDIFDGHYLTGISRFINATILTSCIAVGLMLGFLWLNQSPL